jgi:hypothetical protein
MVISLFQVNITKSTQVSTTKSIPVNTWKSIPVNTTKRTPVNILKKALVVTTQKQNTQKSLKASEMSKLSSNKPRLEKSTMLSPKWTDLSLGNMGPLVKKVVKHYKASDTQLWQIMPQMFIYQTSFIRPLSNIFLCKLESNLIKMKLEY